MKAVDSKSEVIGDLQGHFQGQTAKKSTSSKQQNYGCSDEVPKFGCSDKVPKFKYPNKVEKGQKAIRS